MNDGNLTTGDGAVTFNNTLGLDNGSNITSNLGGITFNEAVTIAGASTVNVNGEGNLLFDGDLTLTSGSLIIPDGAAADTYGSITLAGLTNLVGTTSIIDLGTNADLIITGSITNGGDGTNLVLNCASTVTYNDTDAGQVVLPTLNTDTHRYGNLVLSGNSKLGGTTTTYGNDINICTDFSLDGGNLDMVTNSGVLRMNNPAGEVTYGASSELTDLEEVTGKFERVIGGSSDELIFNNSATRLTLTAGAADLTSLTLDVRPGSHANIPTAGAGITDGFNVLTDVNRQVRFSYSSVLANPIWVSKLQVGFLDAEDPTDGTNLRFREVKSVNETEKVATGQEITRNNDQDFRFVSLDGIRPTNSNSLVPAPSDLALVANDAWLYLSGAATKFYSVQDGRWSNPNTWDEGTWPSANDDVQLRHMVYVGIPGPFAGTDAAGNTTPESDATRYGADGAAAKTITIVNDINYANASLIIANMDNGADYLFKTSATTGTSFTNLNPTAPAYTFADRPADKASFPANSNWAKGLWILPFYGGTPASTYTAFGTNQIENSGTINNEGVIELGQ